MIVEITLSDLESSILLEALNESFHKAIEELKNSPNILHTSIFTTKRDESLKLIHKIEKLCV